MRGEKEQFFFLLENTLQWAGHRHYHHMRLEFECGCTASAPWDAEQVTPILGASLAPSTGQSED